MKPEEFTYLKETLDELEDYLDNRADVDDGQPNTAMRLFQKVRRLQEVIAEIELRQVQQMLDDLI